MDRNNNNEASFSFFSFFSSCFILSRGGNRLPSSQRPVRYAAFCIKLTYEYIIIIITQWALCRFISTVSLSKCLVVAMSATSENLVSCVPSTQNYPTRKIIIAKSRKRFRFPCSTHTRYRRRSVFVQKLFVFTFMRRRPFFSFPFVSCVCVCVLPIHSIDLCTPSWKPKVPITFEYFPLPSESCSFVFVLLTLNRNAIPFS